MGCNPSGVKQTFYRGCLKPSENTDVCNMIQNSSKIIEVTTKIVFYLGAPKWGTVLKDCSIRKVENH